MTEQERRRRRRERERQMRTTPGARRKTEKKSGLLSFRIYVTAVLTGGCLLISMFHTETSAMVCEKVKTTIAAQISAEELAGWKDRVTAYFKEKEIVFPVFEETDPTEEKKTYRPDTEPSCTDRSHMGEKAGGLALTGGRGHHLLLWRAGASHIAEAGGS